MKHLYRLKKVEYEEGAKVTLQNAKNHINVSIEAAKINQFGIANSLLITGMEELAKASILKIKSINNQIRIENLDKYFKSHTLKHESIYQIFIASISFSETEEDNESNETEPIQLNNEFWIGLLVVVVIIGVIIYFVNKSANKDSNDKMQESKTKDNSLEGMRKSGLYVGFDSESRKWELPNEIISKNSYEGFKSMVDLAFATIEQSLFKGKIDKENILDFVDKLEDEKIITEHLKDIKKEIE